MAADGGGLEAGGATRARVFEVLERRLDRQRRAPLAVGLSGGGDSVGLLMLVADWARAAGRRVLALTVDHRLHPDSAQWTAAAGRAAGAFGAEWRALSWEGAKPEAGLPAAARRARHALLAEAARGAGASVLLLGHTADDVAESDLIRRDTPNHGRLREWAPSPVWPEGRGVFLLRPLLGASRRSLRDLLMAEGQGWLEDPANTDIRYARARARGVLRRQSCPPVRASEPEGPPPSEEAPDLTVGPDGTIALRMEALDKARRGSALARAIACASGRDAAPSGHRVARLLARLSDAGPCTATLGGTRIAFAEGGATLCRELGRWPPPPAGLTTDWPAVFDGRFEVVADAPGWRVAPLAGHAALLPTVERRRLAGVLATARPALPVFLDPAGAARLPRPFGDGPGEATELVSARLAAALGRIDSERELA